MTNEEFTKFCNRLSSPPNAILGNIQENPPALNFLHGAIGLSTEAGELLDNAKRAIVYRKGVDFVNAKEEVGDCLHYLAYICIFLGITFEDAMKANVAKLEQRYPNGFNTDNAVNRDLDAERKAIQEA